MSLDFDLEDPIFTQAQLLQLVPGLSSGTLQNWIARGVIEAEDKPQKHAKSYWSATAVIVFRIMVEMVRVGLKPSQAHDIACEILQEVDSFVARFERSPGENGVPEYTLEGDRMPEYRRFRVFKKRDSDDYAIRELRLENEDIERALLIGQYVSIVVEADILFLAALNAVARLRASGKWRHPKEGKGA